MQVSFGKHREKVEVLETSVCTAIAKYSVCVYQMKLAPTVATVGMGSKLPYAMCLIFTQLNVCESK